MHDVCMYVEKKSITRFNPSMLELRGFVSFDPFNFHGAVLPFICRDVLVLVRIVTGVYMSTARNLHYCILV